MSADLHVRRCARHADREAAARCPGCQGFFWPRMRGRIRWTAALRPRLAREARAGAGRTGAGRMGMRRALSLAAGIMALWIAFYAVGEMLVKAPPR